MISENGIASSGKGRPTRPSDLGSGIGCEKHSRSGDRLHPAYGNIDHMQPSLRSVKNLRFLIVLLLLGISCGSHAGDTPIYPFRLGGWDFTLSSVGTPGGGPIVAVLEAKHKEKNISGEVSLDYRWYALAHNQFDKGEKAAKPFFESLVAFSASEWNKGLNGKAVLQAMKDSPPTPDYKQSFDFLVNGQKE